MILQSANLGVLPSESPPVVCVDGLLERFEAEAVVGSLCHVLRSMWPSRR